MSAVLSTVLARHPRYILLFIVILALSVYTLLPHFVPVRQDSTSRTPSPNSHARWLQETLAGEEDEYQTTLMRREELVKQYGPTAEDVESFPTNRDSYTLWDFFIPSFQCPFRVERIGRLGDGGKWVCGMSRVAKQKECVIYAFGLNREVSFEADLLRRAPNCQLWGYDFSVDSIGPAIETEVDRNNVSLSHRAHFKAYALGDTDLPTDVPPRYTLKSLMALNDHSFIDILKIDIESWEFEALEHFVEPYLRSGEPLPIGQMQIEIHATVSSGYSRFAKFKAWWEKLEKAGLRPFWTEVNSVYVNILRSVRPDLAEYSFMNIRGEHALVSDAWIQ